MKTISLKNLNHNQNINFQQSVNTVVTGNINVANQINVMNVAGRRKRETKAGRRISDEHKKEAALHQLVMRQNMHPSIII